MKKKITFLGGLLILAVASFIYFTPVKVGAVSVFNSQQLAPSAVNGYILSTNGTANSWIVNPGTFPFTPFTSYNGTSTPIGFSAGLFTNGSTTITSVGTGFVQAVNGLLSAAALTAGQITTALGFTPPPNTRNLTVAGTANQITSSAGAQDLSADRTWTLSLPNLVIFPIAFNATYGTTTYASSTALTAGNLAATNATTTTLAATGAGIVNCNGTSAVTTSSTGVFGCTAQPQGTITNITGTWPIISSEEATPNLTFGWATTSQPSSSNLWVSNGSNGFYGVATSSVTINAPLSGTIVGVGTGFSLSCTTASAGVTGCLSGTDYNTFAAKESALTFTTPLIRTANTINWVGLATTSQPASSNLLVSDGTSGVYGVATTSASCSGTVSCTAFTVLGSSPITITGSASSGSFPFTATTNFGGVVYATSTPSLWFQAGTYASSTSYMDNLQLGSSTITSTFANAPLYIGGQQNNYIQAVIQNRSNGNNASGVLSIHDDRGTDTTYYSELGINSSGYTQATFASQNAGDAFLNVSDGALVIGTASTTNSLADLRFTTGGTASSSIRMIIRQGGLIGIGTTTPVLGALTIATTTAPQEVWSSGAGFSSWAVRNSFGTLYFATTSITAPNATSTASALSINTNSVVNFSVRPTITGGTNSGTGGFAFVTSPTIATPTFTTSAVSPILIGGSAVSQTLILRSTSGVGTSDAIIFQTGNSVERARFNTTGNFGIGTTTPSGFAKVTISTSSPQLLLTDGTSTSIPWNVRSIAGSLYFATSSLTTFATSSASAISVDTNGSLTVNNLGTGIIMATLGKLQQLILSASFTLTGSTLTSNHWQSFTYATSTAWTGTTTVPLEVGYGETINNVRCFTDVGTVDADFYTGNFTSGNKHLNYLRQASTTIGTTTMSTNNSFQHGTTTSVNLGTPASSPTKVTCTVSKTL